MVHALAVVKDKTYTICYSAKSTGARTISAGIDRSNDEDPNYPGLTSKEESINTTYQSFAQTFVASVTDATSRLSFNLGKSAEDVYLDNIGVYEGNTCPPVPNVIGKIADGKIAYEGKCQGCHGAADASTLKPAKASYTKTGTTYTLDKYINDFMPKPNPAGCVDQCAADIAAFIKAGFVVP
ncbi:MAG: hypothetical protein RL497_1044 [Pseudomonadota bacterium]